MNRLLHFSDYFIQEAFVRPEIYFNADKKCIKIGEHYIFLQEETILKEGDEKLHELFGVDLSSFLPKTTSDWVHLGVDGVAGILDAAGAVTGGVTTVIAKVIEVIHGISYFVEAHYKPQDALGLYIGGFITLAFAALPGIGSAAGGVVKTVAGRTKWALGTIFHLITGGKFKVASIFIKKVLSFIGNLPFLKRTIGTIIERASQSTIGKLLLKVPVVGTIMKFFKKDLDIALEKAGKHFAEDALVYTRSVIKESEPAMLAAYKNLNKDAQKLISREQFVELNKALVHKELTGLPMGGKVAKYSDDAINAARRYWAANMGSTGREAVQKATQSNVAVINTAIQKATGEVTTMVEAGIAKDASLRGIKKVVIENTTKKTIGNELLKHARLTGGTETFAVAMKKFSGASIAKLVLNTLKAGGKVAVANGLKNAVTSGASGVSMPDISMPSFGGSSSSSTTNTNTNTSPAATAAVDTGYAKIEDKDKDKKDSKESSQGLATQFTEKNHLKVAEVATKADLGELKFTFHAPHKDNTDGKLILSGDIYGDEQDVTPTLHSYENKENLLADIKVVKGKDDKETVRDGEYKKWERSNTFTTPYIKEDSGRYVFHFMVRDRSIISLAKKNLDDKFNWSDVIQQGALDKGYYKVGSSLYLILKKVNDKGYDE